MVEPATMLQCAVGDHGVSILIMDTGYQILDTSHITRYQILETGNQVLLLDLTRHSDLHDKTSVDRRLQSNLNSSFMLQWLDKKNSHYNFFIRAMNPNYSLVTLPRQQIRPERGEQVQRVRDQLSRQNYQILPDKTKLDATKQVFLLILISS